MLRLDQTQYQLCRQQDLIRHSEVCPHCGLLRRQLSSSQPTQQHPLHTALCTWIIVAHKRLQDLGVQLLLEQAGVYSAFCKG